VVARPHVVAETELAPHRRFGNLRIVKPLERRSALLPPVIPYGMELRSERPFDFGAGPFDVTFLERLAPGLHEKDRSKAIDREPRRTLGDPVKEATAVRLLRREMVEEGSPALESAREKTAVNTQGPPGRSAGEVRRS